MNYFNKKHAEWLDLNNHTYNMFVADFETVTPETKYFKETGATKIVYGFLKSMNGEMTSSFIDIGEMFKDLAEYCRFQKIKIFFHNLSFDGTFICDWLDKNGFKLDDKLKKDKTFSIFRTTGSIIYGIKVLYLNKLFEFKCSLKLLSAPVKALGKCVNIEKYASEAQETEEFYNVEPMNSLEDFEAANREYCLYCERDVEIVRQSLLGFYNSLFQFLQDFNADQTWYKRVLEGSTISQISLQLQLMCAEKNYRREVDLFLLTKYERETMDQFTNGGLTISNEAYRAKELKDLEGYVIDLKSAYPAVMAGQIPYGPMLKKPPEGCYCEFVEVRYGSLTPKNHQIPLLKNWHDKSLEAPNYFLSATNYTTYLLREEMDLLEQLYDFTDKVIVNRYFYSIDNYLKDFVDYGFKMKEWHKKEGRAANSHTFKILLNSAYGIHAKRSDFKLVKEWKGEEWADKKKKYKLSDIDLNKPGRHSYLENNKLYAYDFDTFLDDNFYIAAHKGIANFITAQTRCKILQGIIDFGPENFLYCDTDSLFIMNVPLEKILKYTGPNLGDWELEVGKEYDSAIVVRSKTYQLYKEGETIKSGMAGVKKNVLDLRNAGLNESIKILEATLIPQRVPGGLILVPMDKMLNFGAKLNLVYEGSTLEDFKNIVEKYNEKD